jgi:creatinine amidohydrolase/Fe(II)-dependent formamide hydrolase-like protein
VVTNALFPDEMEFTHAGAMETAAILAHDPTLVRLDEMVKGDSVDLGTDGHAMFRRRDVFPIVRDFKEVAVSGWYGTPDTITEKRATEIIDAVAEHIVGSVEEVWKKLSERAPEEGSQP